MLMQVKMKLTDQSCGFCNNKEKNIYLGRFSEKDKRPTDELLEKKERDIAYFKGKGNWNTEISLGQTEYTVIACSICGKISKESRYIKGQVDSTTPHTRMEWD